MKYKKKHATKNNVLYQNDFEEKSKHHRKIVSFL